MKREPEMGGGFGRYVCNCARGYLSYTRKGEVCVSGVLVQRHERGREGAPQKET